MAKMLKGKTPTGVVTWGNTKTPSEEDGNYKVVLLCPWKEDSRKLASDLTASRLEFLKEIAASGKADKVTNLKKIAERNAKVLKLIEKLDKDNYDDYEMIVDAANSDAGLPFSLIKDEESGELFLELVTRQKAKITMRNGDEINAKFMFYQDGQIIDPVDIFAGSEIQFGFCTYHWLNKSKCGISLRQKAYNIIKLSEKTGGAGDDFGFADHEDNEFGFEDEGESGNPADDKDLDLDLDLDNIEI